jgi:RNA binding exosome subunit
MRGTSKAFLYLKRVKTFFPNLVEQGKMKEPNRESFFGDYLGYGRTYWIKLYEKRDLRKVFYVIVELLEEVKELKEDRARLEKQLNKFLKK